MSILLDLTDSTFEDVCPAHFKKIGNFLITCFHFLCIWFNNCFNDAKIVLHCFKSWNNLEKVRIYFIFISASIIKMSPPLSFNTFLGTKSHTSKSALA